MIKEYPNGDSVEIKGLTVTVKLGDESMSKIRKAALDEIDALRDENERLRELVYDMLQDEERGHNDDSTFDEHVERANELGVEFRG